MNEKNPLVLHSRKLPRLVGCWIELNLELNQGHLWTFTLNNSIE